MSINGAFLQFKRQCGVKEKIITTYRSEKDFYNCDILSLKKHFCQQRKKKTFWFMSIT